MRTVARAPRKTTDERVDRQNIFIYGIVNIGMYEVLVWKQHNERPTVGVVSIKSRNGAASRKENRDQWSDD